MINQRKIQVLGGVAGKIGGGGGGGGIWVPEVGFHIHIESRTLFLKNQKFIFQLTRGRCKVQFFFLFLEF